MIPQFVRAVDSIAKFSGLFSRPLSATQLMSLAQRQTGLSAFGDTSFEEPLNVLVESYEAEANLSVFGRMAARWDSLRLLSNLLLLQDAESRTPAILDQSIERPLFITGLPRSGTTFLHDLLAHDRTNRVVRVWETIYPYTKPGTNDPDAEHRQNDVDRQLKMFGRLAPQFQSLHPIAAISPQECSEITAHVFRSLRFDTTHTVPTYRRWLDDVGHVAGFWFHKRFLKHLQYRQGPGVWVLKCPDHVFTLNAIREVYPDARFVFMHRKPEEVLPSVARLTDVLRRPFTRRIDDLEIGEQVSDRWATGASALIEAAEAARACPDRVFHLKFQDFVRDPLTNITAIYSHFGLELSPEAASRIQRRIAERPRGGYGKPKTTADRYGLQEYAKRRAYQDYVTYFGV